MSIQFDLQNAEKCSTFALGNQRRAPLCERQALFPSCEDASHVANVNDNKQ